MPKIVIDAGHGGNDVGDIYGTRYEKDDNLKISFAIGDALQRKYGYEVVYTRTTDTYLSQIDRVDIINNSNADLMLSLHRIVGEIVITRTGGLGFYIYEYGGFAEQTAELIIENLQEYGFRENSIMTRQDLTLLSEIDIPGILMGLGYMNSNIDNHIVDAHLEQIAEAIADGIYESFQLRDQGEEVEQIEPISEENDMETENIDVLKRAKRQGSTVHIEQNRYRIQVGLFVNYEYAMNLMTRLFRSGYPAEIEKLDGLYSVFVGDFDNMDAAVALELLLRREGYNTLLITF